MPAKRAKPTRTLLVSGRETFKVVVPADAKITYGPWAPTSAKSRDGYDSANRSYGGTLRIYEGTSIIAVFTGVEGYRDMDLDYSKQVAVEEGSVIWKSDSKGYHKEERVQRDEQWQALPANT